MRKHYGKYSTNGLRKNNEVKETVTNDFKKSTCHSPFIRTFDDDEAEMISVNSNLVF